MRNTVIKVGLFLCAFIFLSTNHAHALSAKQIAVSDDPFHLMDGKIISIEKESKVAEEMKPIEDMKPVETTKPTPPAPVQYTVLPGDSLTKIAQAHQTEWKRLFAKNTQIANPDIVNVGAVITIPNPDEQLADRVIPISEPVTVAIAPQTSRPKTEGSIVAPQPRSSSAGNTYSAGYCTWYAKSRRPDLPNRLGNASAWVANAAAQGFATGSTPQAGAIGQQGNHVVYVESVNGDGTVTISEMNYKGLYVISSRTVSAGSFTYIY